MEKLTADSCSAETGQPALAGNTRTAADEELRVLVHASNDADAAAAVALLGPQGSPVHVCRSAEALMRAMEEGAGCAILCEEALPELMTGERLADWLAHQPPWSDFPFVVLAQQRQGQRRPQEFSPLHSLGNFVLLERPLHRETLASAVQSVLRARRRQYATRQHLREINRTRNELARLNSELEDRILLRTRELSRANDRLVKEIAERERAQAALTHGQKMEAIGRLTGGIAHDFNNLLHVINMNLELVGLYAQDDKVKPVIERAKAAARRGARLTGQLLSFARTQSLVPKLTRVNRLVLGMRDLLEVSVGTSVEVALSLSDDTPAVLLDPSQLEMAILNLATNAREAMPDGGTLKIATCIQRRNLAEDGLPPGEYLVVSVSDTGKGIAPQLLPKVFDPFFTTKPLGRAAGLGLSQVYGFARQSGGLACVRSELGQGTTVEMVFPAAAADADESKAARPAAVTPQLVRSQHILVVEDDADVRRVIVECLNLIGYRVAEAANGAEALEALAAQKPDLMVVDYAMPDMTGAEVIARARQLVGDVPAIVATGYADMAAIERLAPKPDILRKPFDLAALGDAVDNALHAAARTGSGGTA